MTLIVPAIYHIIVLYTIPPFSSIKQSYLFYKIILNLLYMMSDKGDNSLTLLLLCLTIRVNVPEDDKKTMLDSAKKTVDI